jgi:hypothetical protein
LSETQERAEPYRYVNTFDPTNKEIPLKEGLRNKPQGNMSGLTGTPNNSEPDKSIQDALMEILGISRENDDVRSTP